MSRGLHLAASRGVALAEDKLKPEEIRLGEIILRCAEDVFTGVNKRNTILGTILLHVPLVVSSAAVLRHESCFSVKGIEPWIRKVLDHTTPEDTIDTYRAFHLSNLGGEMNKQAGTWTEFHDRYDIRNPSVYDNIREDEMSLHQLFRASAPVDEISREWSKYFKLTLHEVYPRLERYSVGLEDLEEGIVKLFVWLLSQRPDGLVVKKVGLARAEEVRVLAEKIIRDSDIADGANLMLLLDKKLREEGNLLNPGTTADLVSAAIFCKLVAGEFPCV
jgi:triphosphoribosyl-dephospho-CoA synthase